jgi:hypothetical protein
MSLNAYDWAGVNHNVVLHEAMGDARALQVPQIFPNDVFNDSLRALIASALVSTEVDTNATFSELQTITLKVSDIWHSYGLLAARADSVLTHPCKPVTHRDSLWTTRVIALSRRAVVDSAYEDVGALANAATALGDSIAMVSWQSNEYMAQASISMFRHSIELHAAHLPLMVRSGDDPMKKTTTKKKNHAVQVAATASADFLAGVVTAGLAASTGPVEIWAGVKAGAAASGAMNLVDGWFDWW